MFVLALLLSAIGSAQEGVSQDRFAAFERELANRRPAAKLSAAPEEPIEVELPGGRSIPVFVQTPPGLEPSRRWPLLLAMHGGPTRDAASALRGALGMLAVWREPAAEAGWFVVSPAMTHVIARGPRTADRLPYEILTAEQIDAILRAVSRRFPVDPNRIVATGISLGSNFSIAYAAARPDRLAAIVAVSTEGESRERLLRNLMHVPAFVLQGSRDPNIRDIGGPRAMGAILASFGYDHVYRELPERGHEGFAEHYSEVLRWLAERPRDPYPKEVVRVPHDGIMPVARRVHWIESDTRAGLLRARVVDRNRIDIDARWRVSSIATASTSTRDGRGRCGCSCTIGSSTSTRPSRSTSTARACIGRSSHARSTSRGETCTPRRIPDASTPTPSS
jgi:predicted esterase